MGEMFSKKRDLQKSVIKKLMMENRNPQGAIRLIKENLFSIEEIDHLIQEVLKEANEKRILEKRQFDIKTMRYLTFEEWLKEYFIKSQGKLVS